MSRNPLRRRAVSRAATVALSTVALGAAIAAPSPALAAESFFSTSSGTTASVSWLEVGELPAAAGAPGNAHFGDLFVDDGGNGRVFVFGVVVDVQCDEGVTPYNPAHFGHGPHGEPAPKTGCEQVGERFIEGGTFTFTVNRKLTRASLKGNLAVGSEHGGPPGATPAVDITWTGTGGLTKSRVRGSTTDEHGTFSYRYRSTGRNAQVGAGSAIGPMVFDDEAGEYSHSQLGRYRSSERFRG